MSILSSFINSSTKDCLTPSLREIRKLYYTLCCLHNRNWISRTIITSRSEIISSSRSKSWNDSLSSGYIQFQIFGIHFRPRTSIQRNICFNSTHHIRHIFGIFRYNRHFSRVWPHIKRFEDNTIRRYNNSYGNDGWFQTIIFSLEVFGYNSHINTTCFYIVISFFSFYRSDNRIVNQSHHTIITIELNILRIAFFQFHRNRHFFTLHLHRLRRQQHKVLRRCYIQHIIFTLLTISTSGTQIE